MLASVCLLPLLLAAPAPQDGFRRVVRDDGGIIVVEERPGPTVALTLTAGARDCLESPAAHGHRHLLEHLMVRPNGSDVDFKLESMGWMLTADTNRDAIQFKLEGPAATWREALGLLPRLIRWSPPSAERIAAEARTIRDEWAVRTRQQKLIARLWLAAYGEEGLDPFGSMRSIESATPEQLGDLHRRHFAADQLVLVAVGPVHFSHVSQEAQTIFAAAPAARKATWSRRSPGNPASVGDPALGFGLSVPVAGYSEAKTVATLAAGLALAAEVKGAFFVYSPTLQRGLVSIGSSEAEPWRYLLAQGGAGLADRLMPRGQQLLQRWIERHNATTMGTASLRGLVQVQAVGARPETLRELAANLDSAAFREAIAEFAAALEAKH